MLAITRFRGGAEYSIVPGDVGHSSVGGKALALGSGSMFAGGKPVGPCAPGPKGLSPSFLHPL